MRVYNLFFPRGWVQDWQNSQFLLSDWLWTAFLGLMHHIRALEPWSGPLTSLSPRGWWARLILATIRTRQFQHIPKPTPREGRAPDLTVVFTEMCLQTEMDFHSNSCCSSDTQDPVFLFCSGCPMHPCAPLTPASCWNVAWQAFPHSCEPFYISVSFSPWDLLTLATNRAALQ